MIDFLGIFSGRVPKHINFDAGSWCVALHNRNSIDAFVIDDTSLAQLKITDPNRPSMSCFADDKASVIVKRVSSKFIVVMVNGGTLPTMEIEVL